MKNIHKIRGKREFLFDDREIAILSGGALIICALIFVLGFLVGQGIQEKTVASPLDGKNPAAAEEVTPAGKDLNETALAEKKPQELSAGQKKNQLSYFQELPDSETSIETQATPGKKSTPAPTPATGASSKKTEAPAPQPDLKKETPLPQPAPKDEMPPRVVATPTNAPRQEVGVAPVLPNVPKSPTDTMQVGRPARSAEAAKAASTGAVYSVQVASSPNKDDADRLQQKFADLGYEADIMTVDLAAKGIWYRVRVGNFAAKEDAEKLRKDILAKASQLAKSPIVIKVNE